MRGLLFFLFKILKKVENFFYEGIRDFLLRRNIREGRSYKTNIFYQSLGILRNNFLDLAYRRVRPKGIVLIDVERNKMYVNADDVSIAPSLLMDGVWEKFKTELLKKIIKEGMVVVDIGANIGYYSLIAAKLVGKSGIVYAFEPEPSNYELLCKNIEVNNYTNVIPVRKAISDKNGKVNLWFEKERMVNPSFSKENVLDASKHESLEKGGFIEVETISLDDFFENKVKNYKVDFIKVDTEGAEGLMVDGAEKILKNNNLKIIMEFWPDGLRRLGTDPQKLLQKLQEYGFKIKLIDEKNLTLEPIEIVEFYKKIGPDEGFDLLLEKI